MLVTSAGLLRPLPPPLLSSVRKQTMATLVIRSLLTEQGAYARTALAPRDVLVELGSEMRALARAVHEVAMSPWALPVLGLTANDYS